MCIFFHVLSGMYMYRSCTPQSHSLKCIPGGDQGPVSRKITKFGWTYDFSRKWPQMMTSGKNIQSLKSTHSKPNQTQARPKFLYLSGGKSSWRCHFQIIYTTRWSDSDILKCNNKNLILQPCCSHWKGLVHGGASLLAREEIVSLISLWLANTEYDKTVKKV